jgi:predicted ATPase
MLSHIKITDESDKLNLELNLDNSRLHAFVGQNGSGKTLTLKMIEKTFPSSYHDLNFNHLRNTCQVIPGDANDRPVQQNGSDLVFALRYMKEYARNNFKFLEESLKRIIPNVKALRVQEFSTAFGDSVEVRLDTNTYSNIQCYRCNKGIMFALGILALLLGSNQPNLVLVDDIEQGLHSVAQRELMTVIKEIIQNNPSLQVIFSTHSPYIVDELALSQVHVFSNQVAGGGTFAYKRLDEHPDAEWAKQTLTTGEFWDSVGEDWVTHR